jgi:FKBP12-rapamycin complex-associated protein
VSPVHPALSIADRQGAETLRETSFSQSFGHDLRIARDHLQRFATNDDQMEIQQAWDIYYSVRTGGKHC